MRSVMRGGKRDVNFIGRGLAKTPIRQGDEYSYSGPVMQTELEVKKRDKYYNSLPQRLENGTLVFPGFETKFYPNLTPAEMFHLGSFGGTYWRPIYSQVTNINYDKMWLELPQEWLEGLNIPREVANPNYDKSVNRYNCPNHYAGPHNLDVWEKSGWIKQQDPYGWVMWYCRFYLGRRTEDYNRQIQRWYNFAGQKGRKRRELVRQCAEANTTFDDFTIDPKTRQGLQHWAYQLTKEDFDQVVADYDANGWPTGPVGDNNGALNQQRKKRNKSPNKKKQRNNQNKRQNNRPSGQY